MLSILRAAVLFLLGVSCDASLNTTMNAMAAASALAKQYYEQQTPLTGKGLCDHYIGVWYGLAHSGYTDANAHWAATPGSYKLPGWEVGALAFWLGGEHGHVAIGDEKLGHVYSTDYPKPLFVGHGSTDAVSAWVGSSYTFKGWYKPFFGKHGGL